MKSIIESYNMKTPDKVQQTPVTNAHLGKFYMTSEFLRSSDPGLVAFRQKIYSLCTAIYRVEFLLHRDVSEYIVDCPLFKPIPEGSEIPTYVFFAELDLAKNEHIVTAKEKGDVTLNDILSPV